MLENEQGCCWETAALEGHEHDPLMLPSLTV